MRACQGAKRCRSVTAVKAVRVKLKTEAPSALSIAAWSSGLVACSVAVDPQRHTSRVHLQPRMGLINTCRKHPSLPHGQRVDGALQGRRVVRAIVRHGTQ